MELVLYVQLVKWVVIAFTSPVPCQASNVVVTYMSITCKILSTYWMYFARKYLLGLNNIQNYTLKNADL